MSSSRRSNARLVRDLKLGGTQFELMIKDTGRWFDADKFADSPALGRFVLDLRRALEFEGWQPHWQRGDR